MDLSTSRLRADRESGTRERIRVLMLEDQPADTELMVRELRVAGFDPAWERVDSEAEYRSRLGDAIDVVLADHGLMRFNSLRALRVLREQSPDVPFIVVSGALDAATTAALLRAGATACVPKTTLGGLGAVVARALDQRGRRAVDAASPAPISPTTAQVASAPQLGEGMTAETQRWESEFVAAMSHEMRTPLHVIVGYNELLLRESYGTLTREQRAALERVGRSARQLVNLIDATLDMCRFEVGREPLDVSLVELSPLVDELRAETEDLALRPHVSCEWRIAPGMPMLRTDRVKLKVILKNLVTNALKFTHEGVVRIDVNPSASGVTCTVSDTGVGISPEDLAVIFEPFQQAGDAGARGRGGVGLGLYIVHSFVQLLGGSIDVTSRCGEGSTFRVWLPLAVRRDAPPLSSSSAADAPA